MLYICWWCINQNCYCNNLFLVITHCATFLKISAPLFSTISGFVLHSQIGGRVVGGFRILKRQNLQHFCLPLVSVDCRYKDSWLCNTEYMDDFCLLDFVRLWILPTFSTRYEPYKPLWSSPCINSAKICLGVKSWWVAFVHWPWYS